MPALAPISAEELAQELLDAANVGRSVTVFGRNSKRLMGGPTENKDVVISTAGLRRILDYEKCDLTVSVEAGMPFAELQATLEKNGQMIALDPPFAAQATVGGVVATNGSGPMRRLFGTARDLVIGMSFATLEGKLVKTGGMVVKNVAGLDLSKLMIGSFGTLAVITSVNFRVHSLPDETRSFVFRFEDLQSAIDRRNMIVRSVLQPIAVDLLSPPAAARLNTRGYMLVVRAGGTRAVLDRYSRELKGSEELHNEEEVVLWNTIREFSTEFLRRQPSGIVVRVSTSLEDVANLLKTVSDPSISRAATGVTYVYLSSWQRVLFISAAALARGWKMVVEFAPEEVRQTKELWLESTADHEAETFAMMKRIKEMFDPKYLLNRYRLYGRI